MPQEGFIEPDSFPVNRPAFVRPFGFLQFQFRQQRPRDLLQLPQVDFRVRWRLRMRTDVLYLFETVGDNVEESLFFDFEPRYLGSYGEEFSFSARCFLPRCSAYEEHRGKKQRAGNQPPP